MMPQKPGTPRLPVHRRLSGRPASMPRRLLVREAVWCCGFFLCLCGVLVSSAFAGLGLSTDHRSLFFGLMQLGEEKTLAQSGSFQNEVICTSTSGVSWYLKISLLRPLTSGADSIPLENFGWQVTRTDGHGTVVNPSQSRGFGLTPDLVYISGPGDADGRPVRIQFRYMLKIPDAQVSGVYQTTIRFTLTEVL